MTAFATIMVLIKHALARKIHTIVFTYEFHKQEPLDSGNKKLILQICRKHRLYKVSMDFLLLAYQ